MAEKKQTQKADESASYLRSKKPLRATRGMELPNWPYRRILSILLGLSAAAGGAYALDRYIGSSPRFRFEPQAGNPQITGVDMLDEELVRSVFADDLGLSLNTLDIEEHRRQVEQLPWVRRASVGRIWPNKIAVRIEERSPIAFLRLPEKGGTLLVDADGVILTPVERARFNLPVVKGIDSSMDLEARKIRVNLFVRLMEALDSQQPKLSKFIAEVDINDPQNAVVSTSYKNAIIDLQMGHEHLRHRFEIFLKYIDTWKSEFGSVKSADLRFKDQVTVTPVNRRN